MVLDQDWAGFLGLLMVNLEMSILRAGWHSAIPSPPTTVILVFGHPPNISLKN
jgi:hypothetical protein